MNLLMTYKKMNLLKKQFKGFIESFKNLDIDYFKIVLYDILFYLVFLVNIKGIGFILENKIDKLDLTAITQLTQDSLMNSPETLQPLVSDLKSYIAIFTICILYMVIMTILTWCLSRDLIYTTLLKKKLTKRYFLKSIPLNIILVAIGAIILLVFASIAKVIPYIAYLLLVFIIAAVYFGTLIYIFFTKSNIIFESIGNALDFGIRKIKKLFIPCLFILIIFTIVSIINTKLITSIPRAANAYINLLILIVFMAWARTYFASEVKKLW